MEAIFHEKQEGSLCAQHCLNALLQGPYFTPVDLSILAQEMDQLERLRMAESGTETPEYQQFLQQPSQNMDDSGYFSLQVISSALRVWGLELINYTSSDARAIRAFEAPSEMDAFICNYQEHWFTIRKLGHQWFNLNSLLPKPELISSTYLSLFLAQLKQEGYSIFVVFGTFPQCEADEILKIKPIDVKKNINRTDLKKALNYATENVDSELEKALKMSLQENAGQNDSEMTFDSNNESSELEEALRMSLQQENDSGMSIDSNSECSELEKALKMSLQEAAEKNLSSESNTPPKINLSNCIKSNSRNLNFELPNIQTNNQHVHFNKSRPGTCSVSSSECSELEKALKMSLEQENISNNDSQLSYGSNNECDELEKAIKMSLQETDTKNLDFELEKAIIMSLEQDVTQNDSDVILESNDTNLEVQNKSILDQANCSNIPLDSDISPQQVNISENNHDSQNCTGNINSEANFEGKKVNQTNFTFRSNNSCENGELNQILRRAQRYADNSRNIPECNKLSKDIKKSSFQDDFEDSELNRAIKLSLEAQKHQDNSTKSKELNCTQNTPELNHSLGSSSKTNSEADNQISDLEKSLNLSLETSLNLDTHQNTSEKAQNASIINIESNSQKLALKKDTTFGSKFQNLKPVSTRHFQRENSGSMSYNRSEAALSRSYESDGEETQLRKALKLSLECRREDGCSTERNNLEEIRKKRLLKFDNKLNK